MRVGELKQHLDNFHDDLEVVVGSGLARNEDSDYGTIREVDTREVDLGDEDTQTVVVIE